MILSGIARFASDPELIPTKNSQVCKFRLVFNESVKSSNGERKDIASFLSFEAWDKGGELINKYFRKGDPVYVKSASPRQDTWEKDGQKFSAIYFRLNQFEFLPMNSRKREVDNDESKDTSLGNEEPAPF